MMSDNQNAMQPQSAQSSSPINWERLEALMASVWEQSRETDRRIEETDRIVKETSAQMKETDRRMQETDRLMQETSKRIAETDRMVKETTAQMKETDKRIKESRKETDRRIEELRKESDRLLQETRGILNNTIKTVEETTEACKDNKQRIRELSDQFISQSGHIVEGLMEPAAMNLFKAAGFEIRGCWKEMKSTIKLPSGKQKKVEIDLYYHDTAEAIAVEVKINCTKEKVDHFIEQMRKFKEFFPRLKDTKVYAAVAALNYERDADQYAAEQGLYVIRVSDNDVFTLDAANKEDRRVFNVE